MTDEEELEKEVKGALMYNDQIKMRIHKLKELLCKYEQSSKLNPSQSQNQNTTHVQNNAEKLPAPCCQMCVICYMKNKVQKLRKRV